MTRAPDAHRSECCASGGLPNDPLAGFTEPPCRHSQQPGKVQLRRCTPRAFVPRIRVLRPWSCLLKTRLLGAAVLIALAVLFVPMFFSDSPPPMGGDQAVSLAIPPAPDRDLQTRTMNLTPDGANEGVVARTGVSAVGGDASVVPVPLPASSDQLPTVNIGSRRPRDVETDPAAGKLPEPTTVTGDRASPTLTAPPSPMTTPTAAPAPTAAEPVIKQQAAAVSRTAATVASTDPAGTAARGHYSLNLSAYSSAASVQRLTAKVRALGYPVTTQTIQHGGKSLTQVNAGPFDTRTAAEAARLKIVQAAPGAPAYLVSGASDQHGDVPAKSTAATVRAAKSAAGATVAAAPAPTNRAGAFAVQVAAMGSQADANALRDKLRAGGFDGFVDSVNAGGKQLWRVRVGPLAQRDEASRVRDQIKAKFGMTGNLVSSP